MWSGATQFEHYNVFDFRTTRIDGVPKLSLLHPHDRHRAGVILGANYEIEKTVDVVGDDQEVNMHEFMVIDNGRHVLVTTELTSNSTLQESLAVGFNGGGCCANWQGFREIDVQSSEVLFEWDPHGRIGLNESTELSASVEEMCTNCWDILSVIRAFHRRLCAADKQIHSHLNSVDKFPDSDYLLSSRHTDTVYKISHRDGSIVWRLGGTRSDFEIAPAARFTGGSVRLVVILGDASRYD